MNRLRANILFVLMIESFVQCNTKTTDQMTAKQLNEKLPTIGILIFDGFLSNEVVAPMDVFAKTASSGNQLFNVILIAKENRPYVSEEGMRVLPDFSTTNTPKLTVLVVPSSNNPAEQIKDEILINFIKAQHKATDFIASHCAGAFMLGESGVADGKQIVTFCSGGDQLQADYPKLQVMNDSLYSIVSDGNIISSNGNLVSYPASLELLEKLTSSEHRNYVESQLLINKLCKTM
jgi:transcriptional regulator GlxA family with amidase domain